MSLIKHQTLQGSQAATSLDRRLQQKTLTNFHNQEAFTSGQSVLMIKSAANSNRYVQNVSMKTRNELMKQKKTKAARYEQTVNGFHRRQ